MNESPVRIDNVVCTFNLGMSAISLSTLACKCPAFEYDPSHFGAAIIHLVDPKCTCLIFGSASGVCVGGKSMESAHLGLTVAINVIRNSGFREAHVSDFKIRNVVGSVNAGVPVNLMKIYNDSSITCSYNPVLFPGLRCKPVESHSSSALIYDTGAVVITGCRSVSSCQSLGCSILKLCRKYALSETDAKELKAAEAARPAKIESAKSQLRGASGKRVYELRETTEIVEGGMVTCMTKEHDTWSLLDDDDTDLANFEPPTSYDVAMQSAKQGGIETFKQEAKRRRGAH
jgi:transcription initiation factor TFIID TATA-box-binding protein